MPKILFPGLHSGEEVVWLGCCWQHLEVTPCPPKPYSSNVYILQCPDCPYCKFTLLYSVHITSKRDPSCSAPPEVSSIFFPFQFFGDFILVQFEGLKIEGLILYRLSPLKQFYDLWYWAIHHSAIYNQKREKSPSHPSMGVVCMSSSSWGPLTEASEFEGSIQYLSFS